MLQKDVYLVPTLVAPLAVAEFASEHPDILPPMMAAKAIDVIEAHKQSFRHAVKAGVNIAMGTDAGVGKHGENGRELALMVENGMTAMQAIVASTHNAARLLQMDKHVGTLEVGKLADVIVVKGDVLADISRIVDQENILLVLKGGRAAKNTLEESVPMMAGA
jgi:imidazolonepropionase-like amidohydrolase